MSINKIIEEQNSEATKILSKQTEQALKIIEEQIEKVTDEKEIWSYVEPLIKDFTTEVSKRSIKQILEAEVERLKIVIKDYEDISDKWGDYERGVLGGYKKCLDDQITHLTNIIKEIK